MTPSELDELEERLRAFGYLYDPCIAKAADAIAQLRRERYEYKLWWERDSASLGKVLNELSMERACKEDYRAGQNTAIRERDALAARVKVLEADLQDRDELAQRNTVMAEALVTIQHWDCLNPPRPDLLGDLPWLRRVVDAALKETTP